MIQIDHFPHFSCSRPAQLQVEGHPSTCVRNETEESGSEASHKFLWIARALRELFPALRTSMVPAS